MHTRRGHRQSGAVPKPSALAAEKDGAQGGGHGQRDDRRNQRRDDGNSNDRCGDFRHRLFRRRSGVEFRLFFNYSITRSTLSTTTMASSTRMLIASTRAKSEIVVAE